jgi:hypothetical protein
MNRHAGSNNWWQQLGLRYTGLSLTSTHEHSTEQAVLKVLRDHPPVAFARGAEGADLTTEQLVRFVTQAANHAEQEGKRQRETAATDRRRFGWEQVEQALAGRGSEKAVTEGRWAGFTRGEATAWCWNLFQYEPHGFVHPGTQVRHEAMRKLQAGLLPEVFGYPERARELADRGLTPREYRLHQEALGANTFTPADVHWG